MSVPPRPVSSPEAAPGLRRILAAILLLGMVGTSVELLLLGHTEERMQLVPLFALSAGTVALAVAMLWASRATLQALATVMALFVVTGALGVYNHYRGNLEFELELYPSMEGWELFREAMTGATPALAPGTMVLLGFLGLAYCHRHPMLQATSGRTSHVESAEGASP